MTKLNAIIPILPIRPISSVTLIFLKEQAKEPIALFWILLSPCALFYFMTYNRTGSFYSNQTYLEATSWFYAYTACSVAFFGFALYIVGRREAGFIRSFIYTRRAKYIYLSAHYLCYSIVSVIYGSTFYLATSVTFRDAGSVDIFSLLGRFYGCFILFCIPAALLTTLRINFQNMNTVLSITLFSLLFLAAITGAPTHPIIDAINLLNPFNLAVRFMRHGMDWLTSASLAGSFIVSLIIAIRFLRVNPVWSRY